MNIPLNIDWQQILLHLLNFAILAGGLYFLLYQPVKKFMDQRTAHYQKMDEEARQKTQQAEELKVSYNERMESANAEIAQMKAQAQQAVKASTEKQLADADRQAAALVEDARKSAEREREKILKDTHKELQDLAISAAKKLVLQNEGDAFDQFLDAAERGVKRSHGE